MKNSLPINTPLFNKIKDVFILLLFFLIYTPTCFSQTRDFVNPGLEFGVANNSVSMPDTNYGYGATMDPGIAITNPWYTTHPSRPSACTNGANGNCHPIEVWGTGFNGVPAAEGTNFVELNAYTSSMIYQNLYIKTGDVITFSYRHRARIRTTERVAMVIENQQEQNIATIHQTNVPASLSAWSINNGSYTFTGSPGIYRVGFRALVDGGNPGSGNFLDDIKVTIFPFVDLKLSKALSSCKGSVNGTLFFRINGAVQQNTTVAVELINPFNGHPMATDNDIILTPVRNSLGTPTISHTPGSNIYLITIPPGSYDASINPGVSYPTNSEDGVTINIASVNNNIDEPRKTFAFEIKPANTNGSTNNFDATISPAFGDAYYPRTNDYFIEKCICYDDPNTSSIGADTNIGISLLGRDGDKNSDNWPMIRKGGHIALESNTKGFIINRLTTSQINSLISPQEGMMVYDTTAKCLKLYDGTSWRCYNTPTCP